MSKIALIPIDNRPVCYQLPQMIINTAKEHKLYLPDIELLGDLTKTAQIEKIFDWLENLKDIEIIVLSIDTIAYGGLIPSRRSNETFDVIQKRIDKLAEIIKKSKAKVYAFSSIMRISNNNINEEEKEYWGVWGKKIFEYSYNFHKLNKTQTDVPQYILKDYFNTRERNFKINKYLIGLKEQGLFDTLVFSKDDCAEFGLNVIEAQAIEEFITGFDNILIKTGADEIPLTLLSRAINQNKHLKIHPVYTVPDSTNKISKYEDISVKDSVESQIELAGGVLSDEKNCDLVLLVNNFETEQGELVMKVDVPLYNKKLKLPKKPYFIADIRNANGSDNNFIQQLFNQELADFYGYAGWNTTGNTLGSTLACALTYFKARKPDEKAFKKLQTVRFLDDWAYQANIRAKIRDDINNLNTDILKEKMSDFEKIILQKFTSEKSIKYYFPWNRFFEIGIELQ